MGYTNNPARIIQTALKHHDIEHGHIVASVNSVGIFFDLFIRCFRKHRQFLSGNSVIALNLGITQSAFHSHLSRVDNFILSYT